MSVINTNISAMKAANASSSANKALGTAMERLSTGKRINSAKDDAAGLPIGLQLIGPALAERQLLKFAKAYETRTRWHGRHQTGCSC